MLFGEKYVMENTVIKGEHLNVQINPTANTNFKDDPYIKVYPGKSAKNNEGVARIYLKDAKYVKDHKGIKVITLDNKQREELNKLMHTKDDSGKTAYERALDFTISRCNLSKDFYKDYKIQNFEKLEYRKDKSGKEKK